MLPPGHLAELRLHSKNTQHHRGGRSCIGVIKSSCTTVLLSIFINFLFRDTPPSDPCLAQAAGTTARSPLVPLRCPGAGS